MKRWQTARKQPGLRRGNRPLSLGRFSSTPGTIRPIQCSRPTKFAKITDGTSHTFLLGEKYVRSDMYEGGGYSDDNGWSDGWDPDAIRSTCFQPYQDSDAASSFSH